MNSSPPHPRHHVMLAHRCLKSIGDGDQEIIPDMVPKAVIDQFEPVQIKKRDRQALLIVLSVDEGGFKAFAEQRAIGEAGQCIMGRLIADGRLGPPCGR